jgi:hypothetical protein
MKRELRLPMRQGLDNKADTLTNRGGCAHTRSHTYTTDDTEGEEDDNTYIHGGGIY